MIPSKAAPKRKGIDKDDHPTKNMTGQSVGANRGDQPQKSPPPPHHGVGKGLMSTHGPIIPGPILRLVSHKEYAFEMVNSIIKDTDLDECGEHATKDLRASSLFDLARGSIHQVYFFFSFLFSLPFFIFILSPYFNHHLFASNGEDESP